MHVRTLKDLQDNDDDLGADDEDIDFSVRQTRLQRLVDVVGSPDQRREKACRHVRGGSDVVYWEAQQADRMCALHCLNSLLQGPYLNEVDLADEAIQLDAQEKLLLSNGGEVNDHGETITDGRSFLEGLSKLLPGKMKVLSARNQQAETANMADDGFFSFGVIEACLCKRGFSCLPVTHPRARAFALHPASSLGFICNLKEHWFSLRPVKGKWFNLDSLRPAPAIVGVDHLLQLVTAIVDRGYSVFVIVPTHDEIPLIATLPEPDPTLLTRELNVNQAYLTTNHIRELMLLSHDWEDSLNKYLAFEEQESFFNKDAEATLQKHGRDLSTSLSKGSAAHADHQWPSEGGVRLGTQLDEDVSVKPGAVFAASDENDEELRAAIRLSLAEQRNLLPPLPEEPKETEPNLLLQIRFPDGGRYQRRFRPEEVLSNLFVWLENNDDLHDKQGLVGMPSYVLSATFPRRRFKRVPLSQIYYLGPGEIEWKDVTTAIFKELFSSTKQELLLFERNN